MAINNKGDVYAGGIFTTAGGVNANYAFTLERQPVVCRLQRS